ncbi:hypothetical protein G7Y89_g9121 [Cudoniella acicularis]|uniref:Uncharacterized protein n=1 Tax=Cudoniella acicularis TaxID=354080 RepID=A0A8H4RHX7_9HELO|nr:hypothetical protein G7Y89_g9121 [Cudoniella acicularis]
MITKRKAQNPPPGRVFISIAHHDFRAIFYWILERAGAGGGSEGNGMGDEGVFGLKVGRGFAEEEMKMKTPVTIGKVSSGKGKGEVEGATWLDRVYEDAISVAPPSVFNSARKKSPLTTNPDSKHSRSNSNSNSHSHPTPPSKTAHPTSSPPPLPLKPTNNANVNPNLNLQPKPADQDLLLTVLAVVGVLARMLWVKASFRRGCAAWLEKQKANSKVKFECDSLMEGERWRRGMRRMLKGAVLQLLRFRG